MLIRAGYEISIRVPKRDALDGPAQCAPISSTRFAQSSVIVSSGSAPLEASLDDFGNLRTRTIAPAGILKLSTNFLVHDSGVPDEVAPWAQQLPVAELPNEALGFLAGQSLLRDGSLVGRWLGRCSAIRRRAGRVCKPSSTTCTTV